MLRRNIAATSLKMLCKKLYLIKCYGISNMNVFALGLWENLSWGLTYFDQFIYAICFEREIVCFSNCLLAFSGIL